MVEGCKITIKNKLHFTMFFVKLNALGILLNNCAIYIIIHMYMYIYMDILCVYIYCTHS